MAEAMVNYRLGDQWEAVSAGTKPAGYIHPKALVALDEIGIQHPGHSKSAEEFRDVDFDLVVTYLCDEAEENCPAWLGRGQRAHRCIFDPTISNDMSNFRQVRDDIEPKSCFNLLVNYNGSSGQ